ncbi:ABC transporter permease [[Clostridium] hylemonae]|uniref:ABC transporter permease n=1 Tax=[Clostridium] hylemonae TaxID=89153 RepID=UPI001105A49B|nr:ABC transporter permease [[Clostridium] hylemonae]
MNKKFQLKDFLLQNNTYFIFLILLIVCSMLSDSFLSVMNIKNIALQQSGPVCIVLGMLFVIFTGGIDLSVGSLMALGGAVASWLIVNKDIHFVLAVLIALAVGFLGGLITGVLVAYCKFQGFVASLAVMTMARGMALVVTNGSPIRVDDKTLNNLASPQYGYPMLVIAIFLIVLFVFIQKYTSYGRIVVAIGSNRQAVELAGIRVKKYLASVYVISGVLSAMCGCFVAARTSTGTGTMGEGQELDAIAACVIGGASLSGGKGDVVKAVIGALILANIVNIMNLLAVPAYPQDIIKGGIIIAAVLLQISTEKSQKAE